MYTVNLRHKDKIIKCRLFVVAGYGPTLLGMLVIEVLSTLKITWEVINAQQLSRKFDSQMIQLSSVLNYKTNTAEDHRTDSMGTSYSNVNMLDYFRSSANIEADREANISIIQNICSEFSDVFRNWMFWGHIQAKGERGQPFIPDTTQEGDIHAATTTQGGTRNSR